MKKWALYVVCFVFGMVCTSFWLNGGLPDFRGVFSAEPYDPDKEIDLPKVRVSLEQKHLYERLSTLEAADKKQVAAKTTLMYQHEVDDLPRLIKKYGDGKKQ
jgi:hypothetical protein